eukprot:481802_1
MSTLKNNIMKKENYTNYCWLTLMIRRGDRQNEYAAPHKFAITPKGIIILINYLTQTYCDLDHKIAKIIYIATEDLDKANFLQSISEELTNINSTSMYILNSEHICGNTELLNSENIIGICSNNYMLFSIERLMLFHSNQNRLGPSEQC